MFGYLGEEVIGQQVDTLFTAEDQEAGVPAKELQHARRFGRVADERFHVRKNGTRFFCSGVTTRLGAGGLGFAKIARDLSAQRSAADALRQAHDDLEGRVLLRTSELQAEVGQHEVAKREVTTLLRRLVTAQENERARIARDLHDHLGQQLTALRLALERHRDMSSSDGPAGIDEALALTGQIGKDIDFLAWELRPSALDELGIAAALPRFVKEWSAHVGIVAEMRLGEFEPGQLPPDAEVAFYRIAQEALNNVAKHSHATRADVVLAASDHSVVLVVEDDGVGFSGGRNPANGGFGLIAMRERAALVDATLHVESTPGKGTSVYLRRAIAASIAPDDAR
jgi:signal transduction histidine kinase